MNDNLPENKTSDAIYSNLDHVLDERVLLELEGENCFAQHAAWNFCGYVYKRDGKFYNQIWVHNSVRETICGATAQEVIDQANEKWGKD